MNISGTRIPIADLRAGMFVADVFNENDVLIYSANMVIASQEHIESLKRKGVYSVCINNDGRHIIHEDLNVAHESKIDDRDAYLRYQKDIEHASGIFKETIQKVEEVMLAVKSGSMFSTRDVFLCTEMIVEKVLQDKDVFFGLRQIKSMDNLTYTHSVNVAVMATAFAQSLSYSHDRILEIAIGALLHDIGKMRIPDSLWMKNNSCTRKEFEIYKKHPEFGIDIIDANKGRFPDIARLIVSQHHERIDGSGYPLGLKNEELQEISLLCALTDTYDMLTTRTPFHNPSLPQEALALIFQSASIEFPRTLIEHFTRLLGIYPVGSLVKLGSGEKGLVVRINRDHLLLPVVIILFDKYGDRIDKPCIRNLSTVKKQEHDLSAYKVEKSLDPSAFNIDPVSFLLPQAA